MRRGLYCKFRFFRLVAKIFFVLLQKNDVLKVLLEMMAEKYFRC